MSTNYWGDGHTWGDGAVWGGSSTSTSGKLWGLTMRVNDPHYRSMHKNVTTAIVNGSADSYGSTVRHGQMSRHHFDHGDSGTANYVFNPNFHNGAAGWTLNNGGSFTWTQDMFGGGRMQAVVPTSAAATQEYWSQSFTPPFTGQSWTISAVIRVANSANANSSTTAYVSLNDGTANVVIATWTKSMGDGYFTVSVNGTDAGRAAPWTINVAVNAGAQGSGGSTTFDFHKIQLENSTAPSPFVDHHASKRVNMTHDVNANWLNHLWGPTSGVYQRLADNAYQGFSNGSGTPSSEMFSTATSICLYGEVKLQSNGDQVNFVIGNPATNGVVGYILAGAGTGKVALGRYTSGSYSGDWFSATGLTINTGQFYRVRIGVDFQYGLVECAFDGSSQGAGPLLFQPPTAKTLPTIGTQSAITIYDSSNGNAVVQNVQVNSRGLMLELSSPVVSTITANLAGGVNATSPLTNLATGGLAQGMPVGNGPTHFYSGSGAPGTGVGAVGDFYFRTDGGAATAIYIKTGTSTWTAVT